MLGLYLHIPFCAAICNYCNFNRGLLDSGLKTKYLDALEAEIRGAARAGARAAPAEARGTTLEADTIYFGGGTPSLLEGAEVARLLGACAESFHLAPDLEVTLEANPETVTMERLEAFHAAGVNRISFGVQSFRDDELRRLSRLHDAARAREALHEARDAGFDNVSLDLMMWLPGQRVHEWLESVDEALVLAPEHLSMYMLEVYPNAPLKEEMARAQWSQAPDDDVAAMYEAAMDRVAACGYEQYEISNVARPGRRSRHNVKYWSDGEWLGFGCGAHSTVDGVRWKNVSATGEYIDCIRQEKPVASDVRRLTDAERIGEALFTGLRLSEGIDERDVEARYGVDPWEVYGAELEPYLEAGLLMRQDRRLRLSRRGMLLAHEVLMVFV
jgi:oxygen-independent coproporphyrinogen-3 oxidase